MASVSVPATFSLNTSRIAFRPNHTEAHLLPIASLLPQLLGFLVDSLFMRFCVVTGFPPICQAGLRACLPLNSNLSTSLLQAHSLLLQFFGERYRIRYKKMPAVRLNTTGKGDVHTRARNQNQNILNFIKFTGDSVAFHKGTIA